MPDTEIRTLSSLTGTLVACPVILHDEEFCGAKLIVKHDWEIVGDDYGSWTIHRVYFECGHTLEQMQKSIEHGEYI